MTREEWAEIDRRIADSVARQEAAIARQEAAVARGEETRQRLDAIVARGEETRQRYDSSIAQQEETRQRYDAAVARQEEINATMAVRAEERERDRAETKAILREIAAELRDARDERRALIEAVLMLVDRFPPAQGQAA